MVAGCDRAQPGVRPVSVGDQQQPLDQHRFGQVGAGSDAGQTGQGTGAQDGFLEDLDQRHGAPPGDDGFLHAAQVAGLGLGLQRGQLDRSTGVALGDRQPGQRGQRGAQRREFAAHLGFESVAEVLGSDRKLQPGVVLRAAFLEVPRKVKVGIAPLVGTNNPDLLAAQPIPQRFQHTALVDRPHDPLPALGVGAQRELPPVVFDDPVQNDVHAHRVVGDLRRGEAQDQLPSVEHRLVIIVVRPELQRLQQLDQPGAVVAGVGGGEDSPLVGGVAAGAGLVFGQQVGDARLAAQYRVDDLGDPVLRAFQRHLRDPAQQRVCVADLPVPRDERLGDLLLRPGVDLVDGRVEQLDQGVGDFAFTLVEQRGQQHQADRLVVAAQMGWRFHRGPRPPGGHDLRADPSEQVSG